MQAFIGAPQAKHEPLEGDPRSIVLGDAAKGARGRD
jgi:hypothetical protein